MTEPNNSAVAVSIEFTEEELRPIQVAMHEFGGKDLVAYIKNAARSYANEELSLAQMLNDSLSEELPLD